MNDLGRDESPGRLCRAELSVIGILGLALLTATVGIVILSIRHDDIPPTLAAIASASLTALISILISPRR